MSRSIHRTLDGLATRRLVEEYGVSFAAWRIADNAQAVAARASEIGFPVALKTAAADIIHKSDVGCVIVDIEDHARLDIAYETIIANAAKARTRSPGLVLIERMTTGIAEVMIGLKRCETFGTIIVVGLGGIWVEIIRDYALRLCPITTDEAHSMLRELRGQALLEGGRGRPRCDLDAIAKMAAAVGRLGAARADIVELDLNPVLVMETGALAIDGRVVLEQ